MSAPALRATAEYRRQGDEQRGSARAAETELLQHLDDRHFAGSRDDEKRSGGGE